MTCGASFTWQGQDLRHPVTRKLMAKQTRLDDQICEMSVLGGAVLGGGGGGTLEAGLRLGQSAVELGDAVLVEPSDIPPSREKLVAVATYCKSDVEAIQLGPLFHKGAVDLLMANTEATIGGVVNCGSGAVDTVVGWEQAALFGMPLVDLVFDCSIHPLAVLGLLARWPQDGEPIGVAIAGGRRGARVTEEVFSRGRPPALIRGLHEAFSHGVGGLALAIGPLSMEWSYQHGSPSLVSQAISIGRAMMELAQDQGRETANAASHKLGGQLVALGTVTDVVSHGAGDRVFSVIHLRDQQNRPLELVHWHRYVSLDAIDQRIATFPDLIITLGARGTPVSGAEVGRGLDLYIVVVPSEEEPSPEVSAWRSVTYRDMEGLIGRPMPP